MSHRRSPGYNQGVSNSLASSQMTQARSPTLGSPAERLSRQKLARGTLDLGTPEPQ